MRGFSAAVICVLLLMMYVQRNDCCCNANTSDVNCSITRDTAEVCITDSKNHNCDDGTTVEFNGITVSHNVTILCTESGRGILQNLGGECYPDSFMCNIICNEISVQYDCVPENATKLASFSPTKPTEHSTDSLGSMNGNSTMNSKTQKPSTSSSSTGTSRGMFISTGKTNIIEIPSSTENNTIIPTLLAVIIILMALFICIMVVTMIIRKLRKRKHRYTINGRGMIQQENIYQIGDGNRRPSRIIPIVTHGGECLEMTEFPRYNDMGSHHKLSNASLSMSCEKGGFPTDPTDKAVSMATGFYPNGGYPQEHFYSVIPAKKVSLSDEEYLQMRSPFPVQPDRHHPQVHTPQIHITHSSQSSLNGDIDPYSTLDEARNEALVEIRSTHTIDEQSDDILMLNMFGSDKPKWTHDMRPLRLNVPTSRNVSGRVSLGDEDEYITMSGGDLDGGWGEVRTRFHRSGIESTDGFRQGYEDKSGFDLPEKIQYNPPLHVLNHPPQEQKENDAEMDKAPPTPDKSIEDLYAKVRKKSRKSDQFSESSDDEITFIVDDNESTSQREYLISPNLKHSEVTKKDQVIHKGQKNEEMIPPLSGENGSTNQGERSAHIEVQAGKMSKQACGSTHTL